MGDEEMRVIWPGSEILSRRIFCTVGHLAMSRDFSRVEWKNPIVGREQGCF